MRTTTVKQGHTKNILIIVGIFLGLLILNAILENVASLLAFYF